MCLLMKYVCCMSRMVFVIGSDGLSVLGLCKLYVYMLKVAQLTITTSVLTCHGLADTVGSNTSYLFFFLIFYKSSYPLTASTPPSNPANPGPERRPFRQQYPNAYSPTPPLRRPYLLQSAARCPTRRRCRPILFA